MTTQPKSKGIIYLWYRRFQKGAAEQQGLEEKKLYDILYIDYQRKGKYGGMPGPGTPELTTRQKVVCHQSKLKVESWAEPLENPKLC